MFNACTYRPASQSLPVALQLLLMGAESQPKGAMCETVVVFPAVIRHPSCETGVRVQILRADVMMPVRDAGELKGFPLGSC